MKTLLYLAAGPYLDAYSELPFDKLIFVEKNDQYWGRSYEDIPVNAKWIKKDALVAIDELISRGIKIDYLVSLNEGLGEGGGGYAMLSDEVMGYLSPILKDEFILICDFSHYDLFERDQYKNFDWGFEKVEELKDGDSGFINPKTFTESQQYNSGSYGHVYKMKRISQTRKIDLNNQIVDLKIIHGSIWDDEAKLDAIGLSYNHSRLAGDAAYNSQSISDFFDLKPKVFNLRGKTFDDVLAYCEQHKIKHLGLCPWLNHNYQEVVERLQGVMPQCLERISFYHLNRDDFKELYTSSADFYLDSFPRLFTNLKNDAPNWSYFEEALNFGIGKYIFPLCKEIDKYSKANPLEEKPHIRQIKVKFKDLRVHLSYKNEFYNSAIQRIRDVIYEELNQNPSS